MTMEKLYLDTSVVSAYYDKRRKERQEATVKFWEEVLPRYQAYVSEITIEEIERTKDIVLRKKLMMLIEKFKILRLNTRIKEMSEIYVREGIFPEKYIDDSLHVAVASYYKISYLLSWNFKHLVKVKTRKLVNSVNILKGFEEIEIVSPQEL